MEKVLRILVILFYSTIASALIAQETEKSDMEVNDRDFFEYITKADEIVFFDDNGVRTSLDTKCIWGYSYKGDLHINVGGEFHKIDFVGRISHFIALKTTYEPLDFLEGYQDIWYNTPFVITLKHKEYLVDIVDNKVWEFDLDALELVL